MFVLLVREGRLQDVESSPACCLAVSCSWRGNTGWRAMSAGWLNGKQPKPCRAGSAVQRMKSCAAKAGASSPAVLAIATPDVSDVSSGGGRASWTASNQIRASFS
jgi:hypothetical protein